MQCTEMSLRVIGIKLTMGRPHDCILLAFLEGERLENTCDSHVTLRLCHQEGQDMGPWTFPAVSNLNKIYIIFVPSHPLLEEAKLDSRGVTDEKKKSEESKKAKVTYKGYSRVS